MKNINQKFIERLETELLSTLFDYIVPFLNKKINVKVNDQGQKTTNLENIVNKPKIDFKDIRELEELILKNLDKNTKVNKNIGIGKNDIFYSLNLRRQKNKNENSNKYSISIKYEENPTEEKLKISVKSDGKDIYSAETANKKEIPDKIAPYRVTITYEDNYAEERLNITYRQQLKNYVKKHIEEKEDMTNRVPLKWLNILPENIMGGVLGFTYLGENFMGRRADLVGKTARMVDIHESIHTPDEYETRVLTSWIMEKARGKYLR